MQEKKETLKQQFARFQKLDENEMEKTSAGSTETPPDCPYQNTCNNSCAVCSI